MIDCPLKVTENFSACVTPTPVGARIGPLKVTALLLVSMVAPPTNEGAPLTEEDLKSALRYRKDQNLPIATVLLKRGEKQKVKNEYIIAIARVAYQMNIRAFIQEQVGGEISEVRAQAKEGEEPAPGRLAEGTTGEGAEETRGEVEREQRVAEHQGHAEPADGRHDARLR